MDVQDVLPSASCFEKAPLNSAGIWMNGSPFRANLPLIMIQLALFGTISKTLHHFLLRRLHQPTLVSQLLAGIILGPDGIGRISWFSPTFFPLNSWVQINTVGMLSFILFMFMIGVKTDVGMIWSSGKKAVIIAIAGYITPLVLVLAANALFSASLPTNLTKAGLLSRIGFDYCVSSFVVVSTLLDELNLLNSKMGRLTISVCLIGDFSAIVIDSILTSLYISQKVSTPTMGVLTIAAFVSLILFIVLVARPFTLCIIKKTPEGKSLDESYIVAILGISLLCGFFSEVIGHHADIGMFLLGLALPAGPPLGSTLVERLDTMVTNFGIPVFVGTAAFHSDFSKVHDLKSCAVLQLFLLFSILGKFLGTLVPAIYCKVPVSDALTLSLVMAAKGIYEIKVLYKWEDNHYLDRQSYLMVLYFILVFTAVTTPLIKILYNPTSKYTTNKRRTIQHTKETAELRLLVCIHDQENVAPVVKLLENLKTSTADGGGPLSVYLLHLMQLVGRAAAILIPYRKKKPGSFSAVANSDHIVNAFRYFEQNNPNAVSVHPFVSISPYASMHDDVCTVAFEKKVVMVILPFHKKMAIDGSLESVNQALQTMNINVLAYAPCSVGILVDHELNTGSSVALPGRVLHNIAVYFLGGADDREALSVAMRMAENPNVGVTVVRFLLPGEWREESSREEMMMDDEIIGDFRLNNTSGERVLYREELVEDGEAMVTKIRTISESFSLLIVGRGEGRESILISGLSMWSEFPELGVVGDMLASTDFGSTVPVLVVQQQKEAGRAQDNSPKYYNTTRSLDERNDGIVEPVPARDGMEDELIQAKRI